MNQTEVEGVPCTLSQLAPVAVALAEHLQSKYKLSFYEAWIRLLRMLPGPSTLQFEGPDSLVPCMLADQLLALEQRCASTYSVQLQECDIQRCVTGSLPITFVCWNVNGITSSLPAVYHILEAVQPLALILTETHLRAKQLSAPWMRSLQERYNVHASCFPNVTTPSVPAGSSKQRAGVLIATHKAYFRDQYVSNHQVPSELKGFMQHVSLHSPHSYSLHILGVYNPPHSSPDCMQIQRKIFAYVQQLQPRLQSSGARLLLAGDFNAALHMQHRSSGRLTAIDRSFHAFLDDCNLQSCFSAPPSRLPPTCRSVQWGSRYSHSRIDHFLTCEMPGQCVPFTSDVAQNVLSDAMYESSDHSPLQLRLQDPEALICTMTTVPDATHIEHSEMLDRLAFSSFSPAAIKEWQTCFLAAHTADMSSAMNLTRAAFDSSADAVSQEAFQCLADKMDALIQGAMHCAQQCYPVQQRAAPELHSKRGRRDYLPRKQAKRHQGHIQASKACRLLANRAFQLRQHDLPFSACLADLTFMHVLSYVPELADDIQYQPSYDALFRCLQGHRQNEQKAIKIILKDHEKEVHNRHRQKWQKLWYSKRKRAYAQVLSQVQDERGSAPTQVAA